MVSRVKVTSERVEVIEKGFEMPAEQAEDEGCPAC